MTEFIVAVGEVINPATGSGIFGMVGQTATTVLSNDLLLLPFVIMVVGLVVGIFSRILNIR